MERIGSNKLNSGKNTPPRCDIETSDVQKSHRQIHVGQNLPFFQKPADASVESVNFFAKTEPHSLKFPKAQSGPAQLSKSSENFPLIICIVLRYHCDMPSESENQFALTRAARRTRGANRTPHPFYGQSLKSSL